MHLEYIALTLIPGIGPRTIKTLCEVYGDPREIFKLSYAELLQFKGFEKQIALNISNKATFNRAEEEIKFCEKNGIDILTPLSEEYPKLLKEINDPPYVLYFKGEKNILKNEMISFVGTRKITAYGRKSVSDLIEGLGRMGRCVNVVSGLAYGVDAMAHRQSMEKCIPTIAVLPCPLNNIYPAEHFTLAEKIISSGGGLLTEYHSGAVTNGKVFRARNRLIAGISTGTVIVESPKAGGSVMTANLAFGYDRILMAVPGRMDDRNSQGCNDLIKSSKAMMVTCAEDIAEGLSWDLTSPGNDPQTDNSSQLGDTEIKLAAVFNIRNPISLDELIEKMDMDRSGLSLLLLDLELNGKITSLPGNFYQYHE